MSSLSTLLDELQSQGITLSLQGEDLRCRAPKAVLTPALSQRIQQHKPAILALLKQSSATLAPIPQAARNQPIPLSFSQQRLWFLAQMEPESAYYNTRLTIRLYGKLDEEALRQTLLTIMHRHESLRTTFTLVDGQPRQQIRNLDEAGTAWTILQPTLDWRHLPQHEQDEQVRTYLSQQTKYNFDLTNGPLLRANLLQLQDDLHLLLLVRPHIVSDEWSGTVLFRELGAIYDALSQNQPSPLPDLPIQYADFSLWQRTWLQGEAMQKQLDYWLAQFAGELPVLALPTDHARPLLQQHHGASHTFTVDTAVYKQLQSLCRSEGCTLFTLLLASYSLLLHRYTGQEEIIIGTPMTNRNRAELEALIGCFLNSLALRFTFANQPTFRSYLRSVQSVATSAYAHQEMPFEVLLEHLPVARDTSRHPLFQTMFTLAEDYVEQSWQSAELKLVRSREIVGANSSKFDLTVHVSEAEAYLNITFNYDSDLFEASSMQRMAAHFHHLLGAIVAQPDVAITQLPLLTQQQRQQQLVEWNDTARPYPKEINIHQQFERQLRLHPNAPALRFHDGQLSYAELQQRANQLAHRLQQEGVQIGDIVALCANRSAAMIIAILAILKVGAAYLPLDPNQPTQRLSLLLQDARAKLVLADSENIPRLQGGEWKSIAIQQPQSDTGSTDAQLPNISVAVSSEAAAYVMYTSGSTGTPKGVVIPHRAVLRLVCNTNYITISPQDVIAQASNPMFDAATFEIWGALLNGASLVELATDILLSPTLLSNQLQRQGVTILFVTTALFHRLADLSPACFQTLRVLLFGGETADVRWVRKVLEAGRPQQMLNGYGPTENCTFSACYAVENLAANVTTLPIGKPIANTQLYILDAHLQPVPIGVIGELHLGGDGLAHGYWQHPTLSNEKFISNPFGTGLLYKTGDLARYQPDGTVEFIGRRDFQVKIRGFRVELGEIESTIQSHPAVKQAIVIAVSQTGAGTETSGEKQLRAYVVPHHNAELQEQALTSFLKQQLPSYMIPGEIVILEALPLNDVGKVDRNQLLLLQNKSQQDKQSANARDELEAQLVQIWQEVFNKQPIGIYDNFFDLGGHSLLAVQLFDRITKITGRHLPLATLFQTPTIEALATALRQRNWSPDWKTVTAIRPGGSLPHCLSFRQPPAQYCVLRPCSIILIRIYRSMACSIADWKMNTLRSHR